MAREARQVLQQHLEADNLAAREAQARTTLDPSWEELDAIERSAGVQDAVAGLPPDVGRHLEQRLRNGIEHELVSATLDDARQDLAEIDRGSHDLSEAVRDDEGVQRVLEAVPTHRRAELEAELVGRLERERIWSETAAVRAALEEQQALVLLEQALGANDAERIDHILDQLPEASRNAVFERATSGERVDLDEMRWMHPSSGLPPPDLLPPPKTDLGAILFDSPAVDDIVEGLPSDVRRQVLERAQAELEADVRRAALERAQVAAGDLDPRVADPAEVLRSDQQVFQVLDALPREMRADVESQLVATIEEQRLNDAVDAAQHAIELDRAEAAARDAAAAGDLHRMQPILHGLDPADAEAVGDAVRADIPARP